MARSPRERSRFKFELSNPSPNGRKSSSMQVFVRIKRDSYNIDTTASMGVQVSQKKEAVLSFDNGSREIVVDLEQLRFALNQPTG